MTGCYNRVVYNFVGITSKSLSKTKKARFITTNVIKGRPSLLTLVPGTILSRTGKTKINKITPTQWLKKKKLSIIIYYDSKSKLVFLFSSLSLSLFYTHSTLFLSRDKAINYKLRSISIHADVRRYQDHHR